MKTDSWGHPALTEKQVVAIAENMIPSELRPYYVGIDVMKQTLEEPYSEWNTDIMLFFKAPVRSGIVDDGRSAHSDLFTLKDTLDETFIDMDSIGDEELAEYDEDHDDEPIKEIKPLRKPIKWHKRGYEGESF